MLHAFDMFYFLKHHMSLPLTLTSLLTPQSMIDVKHQYHFLMIMDQESTMITLYVEVSCTSKVESYTTIVTNHVWCDMTIVSSKWIETMTY